MVNWYTLIQFLVHFKYNNHNFVEVTETMWELSEVSLCNVHNPEDHEFSSINRKI